MGCWNNGILECRAWWNAANIILTLGFPSAILCRQKKVLFKSQNLDEKTVRLITKA
jgi:hypothetical protein